MDVPEQQDHRDVVVVKARPVEPSSTRRPIPPFVAKTLNLCMNCVTQAGRLVRDPLRRRYHRHYHPRHRFGRHHLVADLAIVGAMIALIGVNAWLLLGKPLVRPSKIQLAWEVPSTLRIGDAETLALHFAYNGDVPLDHATVALQFPTAFHINRVEPGTYDATTRTLTLPGVLAPGASGMVTIAGAVAETTERDVLEFRATFHGRGESRVELTDARAEAPIAGVAIALDVIPPAVIPANGTVRFRATYRSDAEIPLDGIIVRPEIAAPLGPIGDSDLAWGAERTIVPRDAGAFTFTVSTGAAGTSSIRLNVLQRHRDEFRVIGSIDRSLTVTTIPVEIRVTRHDDGPSVVRLGDTIAVDLTYQGAGGIALPSGLALRMQASIDSWIHAPPHIVAPGGTVTGRTVTWPYAPVAEQRIGGMRFSFTSPQTADVAAYDAHTPFWYVVTPMLIVAMDTDGTPTATMTGRPLTLNIAGMLRVRAFARYFTPEGDQVGRGPLPPRVGTATTYWVTWEAQPLIRDADRVVVHAVLPRGVEWTGRATSTIGDAPMFDTVSHAVTWSVGKLGRATEQHDPIASASFELALTPKGEQVGSPTILLEMTSAQGIDDLDTPLTVTVSAVTTELPLDQRAQGKGSVIR